MSEHMIRKQIYLPRRQNMTLRRLAKARGISEAEVIRQALERESHLTLAPVRDSVAAWAGIMKFVQHRKTVLAGKGKPVRWNRQELYAERENRWSRHKDEN